ncbi:MAG: helix-turn-helix domain-containing protein [Akkermansia muciniphila]|nr:helix-turn-helix domain-containing protein [Akkermansia muciniphila]
MPNNTTEKPASPRRRRAFRHLTDSDRQLIETWYKKRVSLREIARRLNVSHSTGFREIKRGMVTHIDSERREFRTYSADFASERHAENMTAKGPNLKIGCDHALVAKFKELIHARDLTEAVLRRGRHSAPD